MNDELTKGLGSYVRPPWDRPFGDVEADSRRRRQVTSEAYADGADNLLTKARRVWRDDRPRALAYVDRAVALPFDDYERAWPAAKAAEFGLYNLLVDEFEASAEEDDLWLEAALAVLNTLDTSARFDLRDVLNVIDKDYKITDRERLMLRAAVAPIPDRARLLNLDLTPAEVSSYVIAILDACVAYEDELDTLLSQTL